METSKNEVTDIARSVGALMLAAGAIVLELRKSGHGEWSGLSRTLVVLIPAAVLYLLALGSVARDSTGGDPGSEDGDEPSGAAAGRAPQQPSASVMMVTAILLWPVALSLLLSWLGASTTRHPIYAAGVFAVTALLAAYAAWRAGIRYAALLTGLALLLMWLRIWEEVLGEPNAGTVRWLVLAAGAALIAGAAALARRKSLGWEEIATAGGIAGVSAGVIGVVVGGVRAITRGIFGGIASAESHGGAISTFNARSRIASEHALNGHALPTHVSAMHSAAAHIGAAHTFRSHHLAADAFAAHFPLAHVSGLQHPVWDAYLLIISLALAWAGARFGARGLAYVGGFGLLAFVASVAAQVTRVQSGRPSTGSLLGWPLILIVLGLIGLVAPMIYRRIGST